MTKKSLWGEIPKGSNILTPKAILVEQAEILTEATEGLLVGHVKQINAPDDYFGYLFQIVVPSLNNYVFVVARVFHPVSLYPLDLLNVPIAHQSYCKNEGEFEANLEIILNSDYTRNVVSGLLAQVNS